MKRNVGTFRDSSDPGVRGISQFGFDEFNRVHTVLNTTFGASTSPDRVPFVGYAKPMSTHTPRIDVAQALAEAVHNLLEYAADNSRPFSNMKALAKRAGIGASTIRRILDKDVSPSIDTVDRIAKVYGLQAYQLLLPDWKPSNPPVVPYTATEKALYHAVSVVAKDLVLPVAHDDEEHDSQTAHSASNKQMPDRRKSNKPARTRRPVAKT